MKIKQSLLIASLTGAVSVPALSHAESYEMPEEYVYFGGHISQFYHQFNRHRESHLDSTTLPGAQIGWKFDQH